MRYTTFFLAFFAWVAWAAGAADGSGVAPSANTVGAAAVAARRQARADSVTARFMATPVRGGGAA
ncbi:hypothetical protein [Streptomyces sp. CA-132043]|uniref:hypothetical protein n=1 Tax=Streptomyces sp. CA-132043 TaxID=3240048 RepID=UPI003D8A1C8D